MTNLESLKRFSSLNLFSDLIQHLVNKFWALAIVAFGPIIACSILSMDVAVRFKELAHLSGGGDAIQDSRFEINE